MNIPVRMRRMRKNIGIRRLVEETSLEPRNLVQPYFVVPGSGILKEVKAGYGLWHVSADKLVEEVTPLAKAGVGGIMLFGVPDEKSDDPARLPNQLAPLVDSIRRLKDALPTVPLFADVCLCSFTTHGHCGVVKGDQILNDPTLKVLADFAVQLGKAGVDFVSPSDMMDGRVAAIRAALDEQALTQVGILSYAVKMASAFYGPFRDAAHSAPSFGDRASYQQPANNRREALRELQLDVDEGADALLIKPAMTNLDLIRDARERSELPLFAYQVSGEYAMIRAAADANLLDWDRAIKESLVSIRRAGADVAISYFARSWLRK
jgi:porphobilinogen synthase